MPEPMTNTPVVMSISNHDPSGGGGISAAIETLASLGCHCTPIITKLAARDTATLKDSQITDTSLLIQQIRAVLEDITINLFCISDLASIGNVEAVHTILSDYPDIPVVLHPSISAHDGEHGLDTAIRTLLLPQTDITILNKADALTLAPGADTLSACAQELMEYGCDNILITGDNNSNTQLSNHWFAHRGSSQKYAWERLPYSYHGAGSTLAAALSGYLAHGLSMAESIQQAQQFTWQALLKGRRIGMGELLPDRMHWCQK
ncbi:MAG: hydroxymethylpyrimidine/phosphomethylpyrimidine kinase [Pseudomonadales bacterium]